MYFVIIRRCFFNGAHARGIVTERAHGWLQTQEHLKEAEKTGKGRTNGHSDTVDKVACRAIKGGVDRRGSDLLQTV